MIFKKINLNLYISLAFIIYIFVVITYAYFSFNKEKTRLNQYLDKQLEDAARTLPILLPEKYHYQGMSKNQDNSNNNLKQTLKLSEYTVKNDITFIYTLIKKNREIIYTASSATRSGFELNNRTAYLNAHDKVSPFLQKIFENRRKDFFEYSDKWGTFRGVAIPMYSEDGVFYLTVAEMSVVHRQALIDDEFYQTLMVTSLFLFFTCLTYLALVYNIKKTTKQAFESEERLSLGLKISKLSWFDHNMMTGKFSVSEEYYNLLGYESARFYSILEEWLSSVHKDDEEKVLTNYQECLNTGGPCKIDYRIQTKSGEWLWFRSIAKVVV